MRQKVAPVLVDILINRVGLSRSMKKFILSDLAKDWGIGRATMYRYDNEEYRLASQKSSRKQYNSRPRPTDCLQCKTKLKDHPRCPTCGIILHKGKKDYTGLVHKCS